MPDPFDYDAISPEAVTTQHIWGAIGLLLERTKCIPDLVTDEECKRRRAEDEATELRATLNGDRGDAAKKVARRFTIRVAALSAMFTGGAMWLIQEVPKWLAG